MPWQVSMDVINVVTVNHEIPFYYQSLEFYTKLYLQQQYLQFLGELYNNFALQ